MAYIIFCFWLSSPYSTQYFTPYKYYTTHSNDHKASAVIVVVAVVVAVVLVVVPMATILGYLTCIGQASKSGLESYGNVMPNGWVRS